MRMRIACVYLPSFPLQAHVRRAPHLAGLPLAIVEPKPTGTTVLACSRAAWKCGARPGMALAIARNLCLDLEVVTADRELYRHTLQAVIESLAVLSEAVDAGEDLEAQLSHRVLYLRVPPRMRGASFGQKLLAQLSRQGLRGRVGVADDRYTAYLAASRPAAKDPQPAARDERPVVSDESVDRGLREPPLFQQSCTVIPRGGSAAFLAPLPLDNLPIDPDIRHLLETCGVKTLGDFADLPPPSVSRDRIAPNSDYQALASGRGPATVRGLIRDEMLAHGIVERIDLEHEIADYQPLSFILHTLCDRVGHRLDGRDRAVAGFELYLVAGTERDAVESVPACGASDTGMVIAHQLSRPAVSSRELLDEVGEQIRDRGLARPVVAVELHVTMETEPVEHEMGLFDEPRAAAASAGPGLASDAENLASGEGNTAGATGDTSVPLAYGSKSAPLAHRHVPTTRSRPSHGRQQVLHLFE